MISTSSFIEACRQAIGFEYVLTQQEEIQPYLTDWRQRYHGKACAVLKPANTQEVAQIIHLALENKISIVPQGGNTGLVGGATPDQSGQQAVLSLQRLNQIRQIDLENNCIVVEAGVILKTLQECAFQHQRLFPLSLASEGSCSIGGNLSTNAGGINVLRYGTTRDLCLGLEVVMPSGEIWNGLNQLRKNNTGYDLKNLFIGAEGTLGVITAAVMKLFPLPIAYVTGIISLSSIKHAIQLLELTQIHFAATLTSFELISNEAMQLVCKHFNHLKMPFEEYSPYYVLIECCDFESEANILKSLENLLETAIQKKYIDNAILAKNLQQANAFWSLREHISSAQSKEGLNLKHDIALPISHLPMFIFETNQAIERIAPGAKLINFGHLGDGNLHYNVQAPPNISAEDFLKNYHTPISKCIYDTVTRHHGTISAEHGIGQFKIKELLKYKSPLELSMMKSIKKAFDPHQIMNPGKLFEEL